MAATGLLEVGDGAFTVNAECAKLMPSIIVHWSGASRSSHLYVITKLFVGTRALHYAATVGDWVRCRADERMFLITKLEEQTTFPIEPAHVVAYKDVMFVEDA